MRLFSGKQLIWRAIAAGVIAGGTLAAQPVLAVDDLPVVDDIPMASPPVVEHEAAPPPYYPPAPYAQRPYAPGVYRRDSYAAMPPVRIERSAMYGRPVLPPYQVFAVLRSSGYSPLGQVTRRGWIYTVAAIGPRGDDGRLIIDARTGRIMRFIPAYAVDERLNEEVAAYGAPGPRLYQQDYRRVPRPPVPVPRAAQSAAPKVASRAASTAPLPAAKPDDAASAAKAAVTPAQQPAEASPAVTPPVEKTAEVKSAATAGAAAPPASQPSASPQPSTLKLWPTQAMPPVQSLD
jgi:hypothetical protein